MKPPCLIYEDDHLLVVNKPAGINTHSPSPFAGEGLYDWLRHREPRWAALAIIHRLDKETSGILVFSKTPLANRSLTEQFTVRSVRKKYLFLTDRPVSRKEVLVKTALVRVGDKYQSRPISAGAAIAETRFSILCKTETPGFGPATLIEAEPLTGRTHQIRVHAAEGGCAIIGDPRYGGTPAARLCLHATSIRLKHPASGEELIFQTPPEFGTDSGLALRGALINPQSNTAYRLIHGAGDGWPGGYVDRLGEYLLSQSAEPLSSERRARMVSLVQTYSARGAYHKILSPTPGQAAQTQGCPQLEIGARAPDSFRVLENELSFELSFAEGYSVGLFLDQRDNRRRLLTGHVAAGFPLFEARPGSGKVEVLNAFSYTCGFSVYAAKAGARATSLDLSKKYLEWGKRNFRLNQIDPGEHEFIYGDVFDWLRRLHKRNRLFDVILLDPPTFSRSKEFGPFRAEKDYTKLVSAALPLLRPRGVLFASCNAATWDPEGFLSSVKQPILNLKRGILQEHYFPQPPDFPIARGEPGYLKTVWLRLE